MCLFIQMYVKFFTFQNDNYTLESGNEHKLFGHVTTYFISMTCSIFPKLFCSKIIALFCIAWMTYFVSPIDLCYCVTLYFQVDTKQR